MGATDVDSPSPADSSSNPDARGEEDAIQVLEEMLDGEGDGQDDDDDNDSLQSSELPSIPNEGDENAVTGGGPGDKVLLSPLSREAPVRRSFLRRRIKSMMRTEDGRRTAARYRKIFITIARNERLFFLPHQGEEGGDSTPAVG